MLSVRLNDEADEYLRTLATVEDRTINNLLNRIILEHKRYNPLPGVAGDVRLERPINQSFTLVADGAPVGKVTLELGVGKLGKPERQMPNKNATPLPVIVD